MKAYEFNDLVNLCVSYPTDSYSYIPNVVLVVFDKEINMYKLYLTVFHHSSNSRVIEVSTGVYMTRYEFRIYRALMREITFIKKI